MSTGKEAKKSTPGKKEIGRAKGTRRCAAGSGLSAARMAEMIEEATVDAYDECEQATGWFSVLEDNLDLPFETEVLGVPISVEKLELRDDSRIVALCFACAQLQRYRGM